VSAGRERHLSGGVRGTQISSAFLDWRKWTVREAAEIFRKVGFVGDFWEIPVTEGGF
jgi:hypothetical protein